MRIRILAEAERDLLSGSRFYEGQSPGLGGYFLECLSSDIESLRFHAGVHRRAFGDHRCRSKRFPFVIYYSLEGDLVSVEAVLDCRQHPSWIRQRLAHDD